MKLFLFYLLLFLFFSIWIVIMYFVFFHKKNDNKTHDNRIKEKFFLILTAILELVIFYATYGVTFFIGSLLCNLIEKIMSFFVPNSIFIPQLLAIHVAVLVIVLIREKKDIFDNSIKIFSIILIIVNAICIIINIIGVIQHYKYSLDMLITNILMLIFGISNIRNKE